jgi:excisionase family DNA binding protein
VDAPESLLTVREVAAYLACAEETVKRLVRRGELPATRIGTRLRFARADVEAYQAAHAAHLTARGVRSQAAKHATPSHFNPRALQAQPLRTSPSSNWSPGYLHNCIRHHRRRS